MLLVSDRTNNISDITMPTISGSTSRTILILGVIVCAGVLTWHGSITGEACYGLLTLIAGALVHASGTKQGADAAAPPAGVQP